MLTLLIDQVSTIADDEADIKVIGGYLSTSVHLDWSVPPY